MFLFNNIKIRNKLLLMLVLPLLGFTIFSIWGLTNKKQVVDEMDNLQQLAKLSVKVSTLVHELQKERGLTAGFLGSKGQSFSNELSKQRRTTDLKIDELKSFYKDFYKKKFATFQKSVNVAFSELNELSGKRGAIDNMSITTPMAIGYYTQINADFLGTVSIVSKLSTNVELSGLLFSYLNFLQGKERAGIERAVLNNTFASGKFQPDMFHKFNELVAEQNTYFRIFQNFAPKNIRGFYQKKMSGNIVEEVDRMRKQAFGFAADSGKFNVDAAYWFKTKTAEIDLLKEVEDYTSTFFIDKTDRIESVASTEFLLLTILIIFVLIVTFFASFYLSGKISGPLSEISQKSQRIALGDIDQHLDYEGKDEIGELALSFRQVIDSQKEKARVADMIAIGDLSVEIHAQSKADVLSIAMQKMTKALREKSNAAQAIANGDLDTIVTISSDKDILGQSIRTMVQNLNAGRREEVNAALEKSESSLKKAQIVVNEVKRVAVVFNDGNLNERAKAEGVDGTFQELIEAFNAAIDNIFKPILETKSVLEKVARKDLSQFVTGVYKGDHAQMKTSLNAAVNALNKVLGQVNSAIGQVAEGARQVSDSSQSIAQGATEQASSLEEITASMTEISSQAKTNADNAEKAQKSSIETNKAAQTGNKYMEQMMLAIDDINKSSTEISKIIKVIDEIAFQTNLLALNAAVEAAHAGVHGKGFAVVAEEVRNLAQRSAKAASETTELIEKSIEKASNGNEIARDTEQALAHIINGIDKTSNLITEIADASGEQLGGLEQTTIALGQIDNVTQNNTVSAEESAAASEQLSAQSAHLQELISTFTLRNDSQNIVSTISKRPDTSSARNTIDTIDDVVKSNSKKEVAIHLDDDDFGGF